MFEIIAHAVLSYRVDEVDHSNCGWGCLLQPRGCIAEDNVLRVVTGCFRANRFAGFYERRYVMRTVPVESNVPTHTSVLGGEV